MNERVSGLRKLRNMCFVGRRTVAKLVLDGDQTNKDCEAMIKGLNELFSAQQKIEVLDRMSADENSAELKAINSPFGI